MYYTLLGIQPDVDFMKEIGFEAFVPGNHEFDDGDVVLADLLDGIKDVVPGISANIMPGDDSPLKIAENLKPYLIKVFEGGQRVGVCGISPKAKIEKVSKAWCSNYVCLSTLNNRYNVSLLSRALGQLSRMKLSL